MAAHNAPLLDITLPIQLTNGNTGRGHKWFNSAKERQRLRRALSHLAREPFDVPTCVEAIRLLGPRERLWDASSGLRGNYKELEDALVELGWWVDDGPQWITNVSFRQDASDRSRGPAVRIRVMEA